MKVPPLRRLFYDLETSPNVVLSWRVGYKIKIDYENLLKERSIICIGYKWQGEKKAHVIAWNKDQCDRKLLAEFLEIMKGADECVGHNIDRFDLPWIRTRCLFHGLPPLPIIKTSDTLQWARRMMYFNSNRLDYIARFLGIGAKIKTEFNLWKAVLLDHDNGALERMKDYCARDVVLLEKVWEKLSTMSPVKTHAGVLNGGEKWNCPRCASDHIVKVRRYVTAKGTEQRQMRCRDCGGYFNISAMAALQYEEARKETAGHT